MGVLRELAPRAAPSLAQDARTACARLLATAQVAPAPKRLELVVKHLDDERTLPVVELKRAA
ncbi:MAG: hypothetical protein HYV07_28730 [Deltaproteobacteria bacterium]|nr:hypothetical protein [Deltaproteobacteria bacterium]